jgi:hypothetical protein
MPTDNVYSLYVRNGNRAGFWVRRAGWGESLAFVWRVGGKAEGPLDGKPPYYGNVKVGATIFYPDRVVEGYLPCPGCYQWQTVVPEGVPVDSDGSPLVSFGSGSLPR